jgi:hypothetical protein
MKKLLMLGGVVVAALVGVLVFVFSSLDSIVKKAIETVGSEVAGTNVTVSSVKISLSEGKGTISGLSIANPKGFSNEAAFRLGEISLALDTGSLAKDPVVVKEIVVAAPAVTYEITAGGSNLDALQKNVASFAARHGGKGEAKAEPKAADGGRKLVVDRLAITAGQVKLAAGGLPGANTTAKLGDIVLTGIGRDGGGATPAQVAERVLDVLVKSSLKSATSLNNVIGEVGDKAKALVPAEAAGAIKGLLGK